MVRRQNSRRGPAPGEVVGLKESEACLGPGKRGEGETLNPWSALLNEEMLAHGIGRGNGEGHRHRVLPGRARWVGPPLSPPASRLRQRVEERFQGQFGDLGTSTVRSNPAVGRFKQEEVRASGSFKIAGVLPTNLPSTKTSAASDRR